MGKISLNRIEDASVDLLARWLQKEHVSKWYGDAESWLAEIRNRHGAYSFLHHFMVCLDDRPIGFCQYYDCFFAQEDWYRVCEENKTYSIDYFIGEEDCLKKGYGKQIVSELESMIRQTAAECIIVQPDEENAASVNLLLTCGYTFDAARQFYYKSLI